MAERILFSTIMGLVAVVVTVLVRLVLRGAGVDDIVVGEGLHYIGTWAAVGVFIGRGAASDDG